MTQKRLANFTGDRRDEKRARRFDDMRKGDRTRAFRNRPQFSRDRLRAGRRRPASTNFPRAMFRRSRELQFRRLDRPSKDPSAI